jgi:hypothetical protein
VLFTDEPTTWVDPPPTTLLETLLIFVGIPLLITAVIVLLVMVPSLAKGPRYSPGQRWDAEPTWFGAPEPGAALAPGPDERQVLPQLTGSSRAPVPDDDTGGASVRW